MKVKLIAYTPDPEKIVACAAKLCYSGADSIDTLMDGLDNKQAVEDFVKSLAGVGHMSPFEHVSFTFAIEGVSRAVLAEITRHRVASFSVQSQRYCSMKNSIMTQPSLEYIEEESKWDELQEEYAKYYSNAVDEYNKLIDMGVKREDARFVLPEATHTRMIVTMNARELLHFFELRCCNRAMWEIRDLADRMFECVYEVAPTIFGNAGASCVSTGKCPEGARTCGDPLGMRNHFYNMKYNIHPTRCGNE